MDGNNSRCPAPLQTVTTDLSPEAVTTNAQQCKKRCLKTYNLLDSCATDESDGVYHDSLSLAFLKAEFDIARVVSFVEYSYQKNEILEGRVEKAHAAISRLWPSGESIPPLESVDCCILAHRYYNDVWVPHNSTDGSVKLMIMAESHASTSSSLVGAPYAHGCKNVQALHLGHLNLVHCLS